MIVAGFFDGRIFVKVERGEVVTVLEQDGGYARIRNSKGAEGYVPTTCLEEINSS